MNSRPLQDVQMQGIQPPPRRPSRFKRVVLLSVILVGLAVLLPISRRYLQSKPPSPPRSAGVKALSAYYLGRISRDPADVDAYVELGTIDDSTGYYNDALRHLYAARALGAKDERTVLPLGDALTFLAHYDEARAELRKATQLMPQKIEAATALAELDLADGQPAEAARSLRDFVQRSPSFETGAVSTAQSSVEILLHYFLRCGDDEMAYKLAMDMIRLAPKDPLGYAITGKFLLARNDPRQALDRLQKASELSPRDPANCYMYGVALAKNQREDAALKQWQKTVALNPGAIDAYYYLADAYARRKDYKHAMMAMQAIALRKLDDLHALETAADYSAKAGQAAAAAYWRAVALRVRRQYPAALGYAKQVAADRVWHRRGLAEMAAIYRSMNRMTEYVNTMREVTNGHTADDDVTMANAYGVADKLVEQQKMLKSALARNPKRPAAIHYLLSQVAVRKGLRDEAEAEMEQAVALAPAEYSYHLELGSIYYERRSTGDRLQRAIREFTLVTQCSPREVKGYQRLGIAHAAAGDLHRAARDLEHALDLLPGEGLTYQELGRVYARLGDTAGSERMLQLYRMYVAYDLQQKTLVIQSQSGRTDPAAQVALAEFLEKSGDYQAAARYYRLASVLRPNDATLKSKADRLGGMSGQTTN